MGTAIALITIAVWLVFGWAILAAVRFAAGRKRLGFWQFTIAQGVIVFTIYSVLFWVFRYWYVNEYLAR